MIQSIFLLSSTGEVLIERHFRGVTSRTVCEYFWEKASVSMNHLGGLSTINTTSAMINGDCDSLPLYDSVPPIMEITIDDLDGSKAAAGGNTGTNGSSNGIGSNSNHNTGNDAANGDTTSTGNKTVYLFSILRDGLSYLAVTHGEISPLLVLEFLHRVADIFVEYFGSPADESAIKDNFSTVYQLLEETLDNGWPLTTELNALQAMIRPPSVMGKVSVWLSIVLY
jgi:hypothetical protein